MNTIWVLENCKKSDDFYTKKLVLLLLASVSLWKRYHPLHDVYLYVDTITYNKFKQTPILSFFPITTVFEYNEKIDKSIFWAASKTKIISKITDPTIVIDHDFLIFKNIDKHLNNKVLYSYDELTNDWYYMDERLNKKLTNPIKKIIDKAANVSLLYFPDYEFANEYANQVLQNHIEFTELGVDCTNYMCLSEQMLLKQWLVERNIPHETLSNYLWDCAKVKPNKNLINDRGIWNYKESSLYYKHYGMEKKQLKDFGYLIRCINSGGIKINKNDKWLSEFK